MTLLAMFLNTIKINCSYFSILIMMYLWSFRGAGLVAIAVVRALAFHLCGAGSIS